MSNATYGVEAVGNEATQKFTVVRTMDGSKQYLARLDDTKVIGRYRFDTANAVVYAFSKVGPEERDTWIDWPTSVLPMKVHKRGGSSHRDSLNNSHFRALA